MCYDLFVKNKWRELAVPWVVMALAALGLVLLADKFRTNQSVMPTLDTLTNESNDPGKFTNKEWGIDFEYLVEWGDVSLAERNYVVRENFVFETENKSISFLAYHRPTGSLAFVKNGEELPTFISDTKLPQQTLYVVDAAGQEAELYTIPPEGVEAFGQFMDLMFSPQGNFMSVQLSFWEWGSVKIFNIETGEAIDFPSSLGVVRIREHVHWSDDEQVLVIHSLYDEFGGDGLDGLLISEYGSPENLNVAFTRDSPEPPYPPLYSADGPANVMAIEDVDIEADGTVGSWQKFVLAIVIPIGKSPSQILLSMIPKLEY